MKVIFTKDSQHGKLDEVKDVADGLAKNLLIAKGFAVAATKEALAALKRKQDKQAAEHKAWEDNVNALIHKMTADTMVIKRASNSKEKIQGSLTSDDISKEIKNRFGFDIDKKMVKTDKLNRFGVHEVVIDFGHGKKCVLSVALERIEN